MQAKADQLAQRFFELPFIGIAISSPQTFEWVRFNDRLCEILGYSRAEMASKSWVEMTHPDDLEANLVALQSVLRGESEGYLLDKRFIRKDGTIVYTTLDARCQRQANGEVECMFATIQDISERQLAEAKIQRLTRIYAASSECSQAIVRCASEDELFPQICRFAVDVGGMQLAWIGLLEQETGLVIPAAMHGEESTDSLRDLRVSTDPEDPFGRGPTGTAVRENRPVWVQDFPHEPNLAPWCERAERWGWRASASLPLSCNDVVVGALILYAPETDAFDEAVRGLLVEMAVDISFALASFAREVARKEMEVALRESESRFRDLYEKAPLAYQSLDIEGNILEVNDAWLKLLGRSRGEVIGCFIGDFMTDASNQTLGRELPHFLHADRIDGTLFHFVHRDGSQRLLMINGQIARDAAGNFLRTHCILTNLTERLQTEEQLKLAATVFEQSAEGIIITDAHGCIVMVNRAFSEITGYSAAEVLGRNPRMMASGRHDEYFYQDMWAMINGAGHWLGEIWNRRKDGEIFPEMVSISQVRDADGVVSHYVGIITDISEHKANEAHIHRLA
ncbi:MAG: PAS domain S-box protein, partial [Propionivibrio sp.]